MDRFLNLPLMSNPINYAIVGSMALLGLVAASLISAPFRAANPAPQA